MYEGIKTETIEFFATAPKGIPPLLVEELKTFGAKGVKETLAGASFRGDLETASGMPLVEARQSSPHAYCRYYSKRSR